MQFVSPAKTPSLRWKEQTLKFDRIVWTAAPEQLVERIDRVDQDAVKRAKALPFIAVTQLILIMCRPQTDYYWLNSIDPAVTFGGLIEHTNLVPPAHYRGEHILYVVNYHHPADERFGGKTGQQLLEYHSGSLARVLPRFSSADILRVHCFRNSYASPQYSLGFLDKMPPYSGWFENVDLCGMTQVYPTDRNMNSCIANAVEYVRQTYGEDKLDKMESARIL